MSKALAWVRKSKGSEEDIGLEDQRERVLGLADELAADVDRLDLGVQTGFSSMTRNGSGLLDQHADVETAVADLERGEYDYLVALDDRRVCRDDYFSVIKYACRQGGAQIVYVREVADDDLTHDLKRRIERDTKEEEIEKARRAVRKRQENGCYQGRPPFGLEFADDGCHLQRDGGEWETVEVIFDRLDQGDSVRSIAGDIDAGLGTVSRIKNQRGRAYYNQLLARHGTDDEIISGQ